MQVPLYLINEADGTPLPHSSFILDVPNDRKSQFNMINSDGKPKIVIGFTTHEEPKVLYDDLVKFKAYTHKTGLLCTVLERTVTEKFLMMTLNVETRVYINSLNPIGANGELYTTLEYVAEDFLPVEETVINEIRDVIKLAKSNHKLFGRKFVSEINQAEELIIQLDILANKLLLNPTERLAYVQSEDNIERFKQVVEAYTAYVKAPPQQKPNDNQHTKARLPSTPSSIKQKLAQLVIPDEIREQIQREINKLDNIQEKTAEYGSVLDYLTWVLDVPWGKYSYNSEYSLENLFEQLGSSHYGLDDVKAHILEHATIEKLCGKSAGSVLCFIGEPGTGKTSIAKEIAKVTGRKLIRIALGGLSDEAELRGHRKAYIGSRPGRFITGLKKAKSMTPLFVLDEIDKMTTHKGDPAAALLEVLDPEQNDAFVDRYLEVPVDLSQAMFICTANNEHSIPLALKDRLEFIQFKSYGKLERLKIAKDYILPRLLKELGVSELSISFTDETIEYVAKATQIRQIEKHLRKLIRMAAVDIVIHKKDTVLIDKEYLQTAPFYKTRNISVGFSTRE